MNSDVAMTNDRPLIAVIEDAQHVVVGLDVSVIDLALDRRVLAAIAVGAHERPVVFDAQMAIEPPLGVFACEFAAARDNHQGVALRGEGAGHGNHRLVWFVLEYAEV